MSFAKIGYLFLRTLAKPMANSVKNYAKNHPAFHKKCISFAQGVNRIEHRLRNAFVDKKSAPILRPLSEAKAIELGANVIGEATLFLMVSIVVVAETTRSTLSHRRKEAIQNQRLFNLEHQVNQLQSQFNAIPSLAITSTSLTPTQQTSSTTTSILSSLHPMPEPSLSSSSSSPSSSSDSSS